MGMQPNSGGRPHFRRSARIADRVLALWRRLREIGPLYAAQKLQHRLVPAALLDLNVLVLSDSPLPDPADYTPPDPGLRWATIADVDALSATGFPPRAARERLERGMRAAILEREGRIVAYSWLELDSYDQDDWLRFIIPSDAGWHYQVWVAPELRGQGLFSTVRSFAAAGCAAGGRRRFMASIEILNRNSIRATRKIGGKWIGHVVYIRFLGFAAVWTNRRFRVGRWTPRSRLELHLDTFDR